MAEPRPFTGYEPKQLAADQDYRHFTEDKDYRHFTEDKELNEHEVLRVNPLSFHQSITASTYDSAESIATPHPESDLDDEQLRALPTVPTGARSKRPQVYHSEREKLDVQFISRSVKYRETVALFQARIG